MLVLLHPDTVYKSKAFKESTDSVEAKYHNNMLFSLEYLHY